MGMSAFVLNYRGRAGFASKILLTREAGVSLEPGA